jgi:CubicO group peptidase (beta-lactamase class C family)
VIGAIIEKISGQSLAEFLQERLFEPLEMSSTGFSVPPEKLSNTVSIYGSEPLAPNAPFKLIGPTKTEFDSIDWKIGLALPAAYYTRKPAFYSGGGGLLSTPDDFAKYLTMVANDGSFNGRVILKKEFADNHKTSLVALDTEALSNAFGEAAQYMTFGGGFGIKREPDNQELIDYIFWAGAFNTFFWLDLEDDSIGIFFTAHFPVKYNISDEMEELVDEARK